MSDDWQAQALRWLAFALGDLRAARSRRAERRPARIAAFHAQQAAEKAVKAGLLLSRIEPPRTHEVESLLPLLPDDWRARRSRRNVGRLTDYAADARYPDDIRPVTPAQAATAVRQAIAIVRDIREDFERLGLSTEGLRPE